MLPAAGVGGSGRSGLVRTVAEYETVIATLLRVLYRRCEKYAQEQVKSEWFEAGPSRKAPHLPSERAINATASHPSTTITQYLHVDTKDILASQHHGPNNRRRKTRAPQSRPLVQRRTNHRLGLPGQRHQRHSTLHRGIERDALGSNRYENMSFHVTKLTKC